MGVNRLYSRIFDNFKGHIIKFLVFENKRNNDCIRFHNDKKELDTKEYKYFKFVQPCKYAKLYSTVETEETKKTGY